VNWHFIHLNFSPVIFSKALIYLRLTSSIKLEGKFGGLGIGLPAFLASSRSFL